jgi:hypothetical protein
MWTDFDFLGEPIEEFQRAIRKIVIAHENKDIAPTTPWMDRLFDLEEEIMKIPDSSANYEKRCQIVESLIAKIATFSEEAITHTQKMIITSELELGIRNERNNYDPNFAPSGYGI